MTDRLTPAVRLRRPPSSKTDVHLMFPIQWFWIASGVVAAVVAVGIVAQSYFYVRLGYPASPAFLHRISLGDDIETIWSTIPVDVRDTFVVKERTGELLVLEKRYERPASVMTISFIRPAASAQYHSTKVRVRCVRHPWLNWSSGSLSNWVRRSTA
jgi:hypothetical protein